LHLLSFEFLLPKGYRGQRVLFNYPFSHLNAYFKELVSRGDGRRFEQLAEYLASPC